MTGQDVILMTGGSGRLGTELRRLIGGIIAPSHQEMDITAADSVEAALDRYRPTILVHAAAYTDVAAAEHQHRLCWLINVAGTRNVTAAAAARGVFLVHVSTDYVFDGSRGGYKEDDPVGPVQNYYALTKLVAEELVRLCPGHLIVRTSFRAREWPYPVAFTDVYTSQDYVDVIAPEIAMAIRRCRELPFHVVHIAAERKSLYELARRRRPDVTPASKTSAKVRLPDDVSLDTSRWVKVKSQWSPPS